MGESIFKAGHYFDHNATTPLSTAVIGRVPQWLGEWGNASSIHQVGRGPKGLIRQAREKIAALIGAAPLEIVFTSGGSEANNLVLKGVFTAVLRDKAAGPRRNKVLVSSVEHPSILRAAEALRDYGAEVHLLPVLRSGALDEEAYRALLDEQTLLVSIMAANNETGVIFPTARLAAMAKAKGAIFHSDCVQLLGKVPVDVDALGVDLATFSGHKFYALKGCGVLFARRGVKLESLVHGGGQERHRRGGTENTLAIAALGTMAEMAGEIAARAQAVEHLRDLMEAEICRRLPDVAINGSSQPRISNTSSLVIKGVDGEVLLMNLDMKGFAVSTGAACSSGSPEPSAALLAMGLSRAEAQSSLRLSLGWETTEQDVDQLVQAVEETVLFLRGLATKTHRQEERVAHV